ncbi:MAG: hypothetical protein R6V03_05885 [Kiritimatiellia bacterium]
MLKAQRVVFGLFAWVTVMGFSGVDVSHAAGRGGVSALVIPARHTIVQFSFDIAAIRPAVLVSYQIHPETGDLFMHVWDERDRNWVHVTFNEYGAADMFARLPDEVIILGKDPEVCELLAEASKWCTDVEITGRLDLASLANTLDARMNFSAKEWRWLAGRYGLVLKDRSTRRSRYGSSSEPPSQPETGPEPPLEKITFTSKEKGLISQGESETEPELPIEEEDPGQAPPEEKGGEEFIFELPEDK